MEDPTFWELPENVGQYRDDRRNVFLDGKSNLVFHAAKDGNTFYSGKLFGKWRGGIGTHLGGPDQAELPHPRLLARLVPGQQQPRQRRRSRHHGVVRQRPLGCGNHRPREVEWRRTRRARRSRWTAAGTPGASSGMTPVCASGRTTSTARNRTSTFRRTRCRTGSSTSPATQLFPILNLAVAGSGGGDPGPGTYPADMLVDWVRVW